MSEIKLHPAHWSALCLLETAALSWDKALGHYGRGHNETERLERAIRRAIHDLRVTTAILEIPESLILFPKEELLKRMGLRNLIDEGKCVKDSRISVVEALKLVLPMAKGYASEHRIGSNAEYVLAAEEALAALAKAKE